MADEKLNDTMLPELGFERDVKREDEGDWVSLDDTPTARPTLSGHVKRVRVRSRYTPDYRQAELDVQTRALRRKMRDRVQYALDQSAKLTAEYCLVDWEITDANGAPLPFSKAAAMRLMTDPRYRDFAGFVNEAVALLQGDLEEAQEEDAGKS